MAHVRTALDTARTRRRPRLGSRKCRSRVRLDRTYRADHRPLAVLGVCRFWGKPNPLLAQVLQLRGCLWRHCSPPINKFSTWKIFREDIFSAKRNPEIPGNKKKAYTGRCKPLKSLERATGVEPATSSLGSWHSTAELRPLKSGWMCS
jgi:hypothetical protein